MGSVTEALKTTVARHDEAIRNLVGWQETQNGTLQRLESKVDRLHDRMDGRMEQLRADVRAEVSQVPDRVRDSVGPIAERVTAMERKIDDAGKASRTNLWAVLMAVGMALLNLIVSLVLRAG